MPVASNAFFASFTFRLAISTPVSKSQSVSCQLTTRTPSAPFASARTIMSVDTRPEHWTRMGRMLGGYCPRIVPAMSAAPYPHFQHRNAAIFGEKDLPLVDIVTSFPMCLCLSMNLILRNYKFRAPHYDYCYSGVSCKLKSDSYLDRLDEGSPDFCPSWGIGVRP